MYILGLLFFSFHAFSFSPTEILYISRMVLFYVFKFNFSFCVKNCLEKKVIKPWTHRENILLLMKLSSHGHTENVLLLMSLPNHGHRRCFVTNEAVKPWIHKENVLLLIKFSNHEHTENVLLLMKLSSHGQADVLWSYEAMNTDVLWSYQAMDTQMRTWNPLTHSRLRLLRKQLTISISDTRPGPKLAPDIFSYIK